MVGLLFKLLGLFIVTADHIKCAVAVVVLQPVRNHILRAPQQHMLALKLEKVGALPHQPDAVTVFDQGVGIFPMQCVGTAEYEHLPAASFDIIRDQRAECPVRLPKDLRIAEGVFIAALRQIIRGQHRIVLVLLVI